ncbi:MAG: MFS transporter [Rhodomicrobium sp.]|nr:MAG: MFS transporter [Rhodomicrobium sp.]
MRLSGRLAAAIEVLTEIEQRHQPAKRALSEWGRSNRFAGSSDRAAIGNLVYDCLRNKASLAHAMGLSLEAAEPGTDDEASQTTATPRAIALAAITALWGEDPKELAETFATDRFAPAPISEAELGQLQNLSSHLETEAPAEVKANMPLWLCEAMSESFGERMAEEAKALASRAPIDIRVNSLKASPEKLQKALAKYNPESTALAPNCLRIAPVTGPKKAPNIEAEAAHGKGWFEIQDEGSQIAALLTGAKPGLQILDYCAGSGGKTLALSALTENKGQIHAYDSDKHRLRPIFERLKRAGCRNVQTVDAGDVAQLEPLKQNMDITLVDAPCTGTGTWRRHPDAKWRLSQAALETRLNEQQDVLKQASAFVKPGGRLVYVTCSLLPAENNNQIKAFLEQNSNFKPVNYKEIWTQTIGGEPPESADGDDTYLTLTPATHGTDGFFIAVLQRV